MTPAPITDKELEEMERREWDTVDYIVDVTRLIAEIRRLWETRADILGAVQIAIAAMEAEMHFHKTASEGDCGFWDIETDDKYVATRNAVERLKIIAAAIQQK